MTNCIKHKRLTEEQKIYIRKNLSKSARAIKKYAKAVNKTERIEFRQSILGSFQIDGFDKDRLAYALERIPAEKHQEFFKDLEIMHMAKRKHDFLDGMTIEEALLVGFIPLFSSWCRGEEDKLSEFITRILDSIYLYTKPKFSLIEYLKRCYATMSHRYFSKRASLIKFPENWNVLRRKFEEESSKNPTLGIEELMDVMNLSMAERKSLKKQMNMTTFENKIHAVEYRETEENEVLSHEINMDEMPLTDLQRKSVEAYMQGTWGWQTKLAAETINPETGKPFSKMTINNQFKAALEAIRDYMELRRE